jgi:hypothetical protein
MGQQFTGFSSDSHNALVSRIPRDRLTGVAPSAIAGVKDARGSHSVTLDHSAYSAVDRTKLTTARVKSSAA